MSILTMSKEELASGGFFIQDNLFHDKELTVVNKLGETSGTAIEVSPNVFEVKFFVDKK